MTPEELQRSYYTGTAQQYDALRDGEPEHVIALYWLLAVIDFLGLCSVLDVGAGTGRILQMLQQQRPRVKAIGIEPVAALRLQGHEKGILPETLIAGDGNDLQFAAASFDIVTAFGVMHHVRHPGKIIAEMLRVAECAVFISDTNSYAHGGCILRGIKRISHVAHLWDALNFVKTRGKMYRYVEEDGIVFAFDILAAYHQVRRACDSVYLLSTDPLASRQQANPFVGAGHLAILGVKEPLPPIV